MIHYVCTEHDANINQSHLQAYDLFPILYIYICIKWDRLLQSRACDLPMYRKISCSKASMQPTFECINVKSLISNYFQGIILRDRICIIYYQCVTFISSYLNNLCTLNFDMSSFYFLLSVLF